MALSVYPAKRVCPSADQAREVTCGGIVRADPGISGLKSSSTKFLLSRSQTLMLGPEAAQSQYLFGEKVKLWIVSLLSNVYKCLPSLRSQSIALASLPPLAQSEPSGDRVTVLRYPV